MHTDPNTTILSLVILLILITVGILINAYAKKQKRYDDEMKTLWESGATRFVGEITCLQEMLLFIESEKKLGRQVIAFRSKKAEILSRGERFIEGEIYGEKVIAVVEKDKVDIHCPTEQIKNAIERSITIIFKNNRAWMDFSLPIEIHIGPIPT